MKLTDLSNDLNEWFSDKGPRSDIVISSRIRLARNLAGFKFLSKCTDEEKQIILDKIKEVLMSLNIGDETIYIRIHRASKLDRNFLVERHLISRNHAFGKGPRGAVITRREFFTAMINEEDHLRIQILKAGLQLSKCFEQINDIDDQIEKQLDYAFSPKYGYLTACPTNLGTGIRVSVMLHLPALKMTEQIDKFLNAARTMNLAVRGLFGEGSEASGDFYQLSNQASLGVSENEVVQLFEKEIIPEIVEYETLARKEMLNKHSDVLDDKISRALALLKSAHLISSQEALFLLSHIRLGLNMRQHLGASTPAIDDLCKSVARDITEIDSPDPSAKSSDPRQPISINTINRLFMLTLPAHLQINHGISLDPQGRDVLRAKIIRQALNPKKQ